MKKLLEYRYYISERISYLSGFLIRFLLSVLHYKRRKIEMIDRRNIRRIVIIRSEPRIGDFVLMSPFLREMRAFFSECEIHLVVATPIRPLAERCPYIDGVIVFDCGRGIPPIRHLTQAWRAFLLARRELRPIEFDLAIVPRWDVDSYGASALAYFSGARCRLAFSEHVTPDKALINHGFDSFATHVLDSREICHEVERSFEMLRFLGARVSDPRLEVWTDATDERFAQAMFDRHKVGKDRVLVAIAPGASQFEKQWPASRFAELACKLQAQFNAVVLLVGAKDDRAIADEIIETLGRDVIDLVGHTTLRQTAAVLRRSTIFIGNCSGPLHLAVAAGIPVVEISCHPRDGSKLHPLSPARFRPWLVPQVVLQPERPTSPCSRACGADVPHCILSVSVDQVAAATFNLLETARVRIHDAKRDS